MLGLPGRLSETAAFELAVRSWGKRGGLGIRNIDLYIAKYAECLEMQSSWHRGQTSIALYNKSRTPLMHLITEVYTNVVETNEDPLQLAGQHWLEGLQASGIDLREYECEEVILHVHQFIR